MLLLSHAAHIAPAFVGLVINKGSSTVMRYDYNAESHATHMAMQWRICCNITRGLIPHTWLYNEDPTGTKADIDAEILRKIELGDLDINADANKEVKAKIDEISDAL